MSKKPLFVFLQIIKAWSLELTVTKTVSALKIEDTCATRQTIGKIFNHLRNVCTLAIEKPKIKLGGPGHIVEIDESLFAKVKYNRGKDLWRKQVWVFGLVDRITGEIYFEIVPDRTAETLLNVIEQHVLPGTLIYSDQWRAYDKISLLHNQQVQHQTVNHSVHFVNPDTMACTNKIESCWNTVKIRFKEMRGCSRPKIQGYLDEFMWRHNNHLARHEVNDNIFPVIVRVYNKFRLEDIEDEILKVNGPDTECFGDGEDELLVSDDEPTEVFVDDFEIQMSFFGDRLTAVSEETVVAEAVVEEAVVAEVVVAEAVGEACADMVIDEAKLEEAEMASADVGIEHYVEIHDKRELVSKFRELVANHNLFCERLVILEPEATIRAVLHSESESMGLFHWSEKFNNCSFFNCSKRIEDRIHHEMSLNKYSQKLKPNEVRVAEINEMLRDLNMGSSRRLRLIIEKESLLTVGTSEENKTKITDMLKEKRVEESKSSSESRKPGRPKKGNERPKEQTEPKVYCLRKRK